MTEQEEQLKRDKKSALKRQEELIDRIQNGPEDSREEEAELPAEVEHDGEIYEPVSWVGARRDMVYINGEHLFDGEHHPREALIPVIVKAPGKAAQGKAVTGTEKKLEKANASLAEMKGDLSKTKSALKDAEDLNAGALKLIDELRAEIEEHTPAEGAEGKEEGAEEPAAETKDKKDKKDK